MGDTNLPPNPATRRAADEGLMRAIIDHAYAYGLFEEGELLGDYAIVAHWQTIDVDDGRSRYTIHYPGQTIPRHVAIGLLSMGIALIEED
jgi:hypothetical protein